MTELEKLEGGLEYNFYDPEVVARKNRAVELCLELKKLQDSNASYDKQVEVIRKLFKSTGNNPYVAPGFFCDNGKNISVGDDFLANYNVCILDIAPVTIGNSVLIGPNVTISTVNHPLDPKRRREHLAIAKPITIGNDVWIAANVVILPGIKIGNNVVVAAGAVVTKDIPDNTMVGGVPAKEIKKVRE